MRCRMLLNATVMLWRVIQCRTVVQDYRGVLSMMRDAGDVDLSLTIKSLDSSPLHGSRWPSRFLVVQLA